MTNIAIRNMSFGEVTPAMYANTGSQAYLTGLRTLRNAYVMRTGGVQSRAGTLYKGTTKGNGVARLIDCVFADDQNFVLEFGDNYIRFWKDGALIRVSGVSAWADATPYIVGQVVSYSGVNYVCYAAHTSDTANDRPSTGALWQSFWVALESDIYEVYSPYTDADLDAVQYAQDLGVLYLVHPSYTPYSLTRVTDSQWSMIPTDFTASVPAPTGLTASVAGTGGYTYAVTALFTGVETDLSTPDETGNTFLAFTNCNLTWTAVGGATGYNIYRADTIAGPYYRIGTATTNSFTDSVAFVFSPEGFGGPTGTEFTTVNQYPGAVGIHQQRLLFSGSNTFPDRVYASRTGNPTAFTESDPLQDDDSLSWRQVSRRATRVLHFLSIAERLIGFADVGEFIIQGDESGILVPGAVNPKQLSYNGSAQVSPLPIDDTAVYVQARQAMVRNLVPFNQDGYSGTELSRTANHLIDRYTIVAWAYQENPHNVIWIVRNDGALLSLTFVRETNVIGWARHDTDGEVESVCVVPEGAEDAVYVVVKRTINSVTKRYVERMADRLDTNPVLMDSAITLSATAVDALDVTVSNGIDNMGVYSLDLAFSAFPCVCPTVGEQISLTYSGDTATWTVTGTVAGFALTSTDPDAASLAAAAAFPTDVTIAAADWAKVGTWSGVLIPYLLGKSVSAVNNGVVVASPNNPAYSVATVNGGGVADLNSPITASVIVGLPYVTDIQTLDIDAVSTTIKDRGQFSGGVKAWVQETGAFWAGPTEPTSTTSIATLEKIEPKDAEGNVVTTLDSGVISGVLLSTWNDNGRVFLRQVDPIPMTILGLSPQGHMGGR